MWTQDHKGGVLQFADVCPQTYIINLYSV